MREIYIGENGLILQETATGRWTLTGLCCLLGSLREDDDGLFSFKDRRGDTPEWAKGDSFPFHIWKALLLSDGGRIFPPNGALVLSYRVWRAQEAKAVKERI